MCCPFLSLLLVPRGEKVLCSSPPWIAFWVSVSQRRRLGSPGYSCFPRGGVEFQPLLHFYLAFHKTLMNVEEAVSDPAWHTTSAEVGSHHPRLLMGRKRQHSASGHKYWQILDPIYHLKIEYLIIFEFLEDALTPILLTNEKRHILAILVKLVHKNPKLKIFTKLRFNLD